MTIEHGSRKSSCGRRLQVWPRQSIVVCLTLDGKAKEVGLELGDDLGGEDGLGHLLRKLDTLFFKATTESDYEAYKNFDTVRRKPSASMAE